MILLAMALAAQDLTEDMHGWTVFSNLAKDDCAMTASFKSGGDVTFHWRPRKKAGVMLYRSPELKSVEQGRKYRIEIGFEKGKKLDMGWGARAATGNLSKDGTPGLLIAFSGDEILSDLAASAKIGFWNRNKLIGSVPLEGSGKAVAAMRRCENSVLKNRPRDPFEQ